MKNKKNNHRTISLSYLSKILLKLLIPIFLFISLVSFSRDTKPQIVLINIENGKFSPVAWQDRRMLAELIESILISKPRAIVVTYPCAGYTSLGADRALTKAVKDAGCVYFGFPLWDALYSYAKGIGHINLESEKKSISVSAGYIHGNKIIPALSALLYRDITGKTIESDFTFKTGNGKFKEYSARNAIEIKKLNEFQDKVCFIGDRNTNLLQAEALNFLISPKKAPVSSQRQKYYLAVILLVLNAGLAFYLIVSVLRRRILLKLPHKIGKLSFGQASFLAKSKNRSIFDSRIWSQNQIWLWLGDPGPNNIEAKIFDIRKFFYGFKEPLGPREAIIRLNNQLHKDNGHAFFNLILMNINPQTLAINFCNAGFEGPLLFKNSTKEFHEFTHASNPLGIGQSIDFDEQKISLEKSDILFLFNSGIVKSRDRDGRFIDIEQLKFIITANSSLTAQNLADKIMRVIFDFNAFMPTQDMIFLVIKAG